VTAVSERPVRLIVSDDCRRGHGSVFFRAWFALPFFLWLVLWALAAFFVTIVNWFATLFSGRSPERLHSFLARFVRYTTHAYAYLYLGAEPLPNFDGQPGYPIDLEIDPPRRQNRWTVAFRIVLAAPALLIVTVLVGFNVYLSQSASYSGSLLVTAAFLGWFVALARARMPRGLRDAIAYALSYGAQFWSYLLLLTDRYPSSDPLSAIGPLPVRADPVQLDVRDDLRRNRLTVFFRLLLTLPHLVWLTLWAIATFLVAIVNWLATLSTGSSPDALHRFLAAYVRYQSHVYAYLFLIANPFPGFTGQAGSYPVDPVIEGPRPHNRLKVFFRLILAFPAFLIAAAYGTLLYVVGLLAWFACLSTAKMPPGLRNVGALCLRYAAQTSCYLLLLTDAYPYAGPTAEAPAGTEVSPSPVTSLV
jgi:Domain of unknown function (DUF4389)